MSMLFKKGLVSVWPFLKNWVIYFYYCLVESFLYILDIGSLSGNLLWIFSSSMSYLLSIIIFDTKILLN